MNTKVNGQNFDKKQGFHSPKRISPKIGTTKGNRVTLQWRNLVEA